MSVITLVLAVVIVILLYLLFKKYASGPPQQRNTSEIGINTETSVLKSRPGEAEKDVKTARHPTKDEFESHAKPESDVSTAKCPSTQQLKGSREGISKRQSYNKSGQGGDSKEWGPMGTQKIRKVPPWQLQGEANYPPNFWIDSQRR